MTALIIKPKSTIFGRLRSIVPVIFTCVTILLIYSMAVNTNISNSVIVSKACYLPKQMDDSNYDESIDYLKDIAYAEPAPRPGQSIFFHETSCSSDGMVRLTAREACAIESAAKWNPNFDVFVLFASPVGFKNSIDITPIINALLTYSNVRLRNVHLWTYANNTPFADWLAQDGLFKSKFMISHTSDFLRYMSMYKFGGIYMDLDVVVQKSFEHVEPNFTGAESNKQIAAGIMSFAPSGFGHHVAEMCVENFIEHFRGDAWINNGPGVITRVLQKMCKTKQPAKMTRERCGGFRVYRPHEFYAVGWESWHDYFNPEMTQSTLNRTKYSLAVHVWNKLSANEIIKIGSNVAYESIAAKNCPRVFLASGDFF